MKCKHSHCLIYHGDMPCNCFSTTDCDLCKDSETKEFKTDKVECKHHFFEIEKVHTPSRISYTLQDGTDVWTLPSKDGVIIMCALCGERRHLHTDGRLEILEKKEV